MKKIAIFASGSGTNAENIIRYFNLENRGVAEVALVVTNRATAAVVERVARYDVPCLHFQKEEWVSGQNVLRAMREKGIDFIVLAGFLAMVPQALLAAYPQRIVNIHPSLLPKYGGKGMYGDRVHQAVIAAGDEVSGITIHYVDEHFDNGAPIAQFFCRVITSATALQGELPDTPATLAQRINSLEYAWYPIVIYRLISKV